MSEGGSGGTTLQPTTKNTKYPFINSFSSDQREGCRYVGVIEHKTTRRSDMKCTKDTE